MIIAICLNFNFFATYCVRSTKCVALVWDARDKIICFSVNFLVQPRSAKSNSNGLYNIPVKTKMSMLQNCYSYRCQLSSTVTNYQIWLPIPIIKYGYQYQSSNMVTNTNHQILLPIPIIKYCYQYKSSNIVTNTDHQILLPIPIIKYCYQYRSSNIVTYIRYRQTKNEIHPTY